MTLDLRDPVIVGGARTPIGHYHGSCNRAPRKIHVVASRNQAHQANSLG
jgi:hypothetical protein